MCDACKCLRGLAALIRYRFFLFAGIFPYLLGQILAFYERGTVIWLHFSTGLIGILLVLTGVELFNEYFDFKEGGDRIFSKEVPHIPQYFFPLGISVFILAFFIGLYLTFRTGWPVLLFSFLGFLAAYFYVGPPLKWAYRGLGEVIISLSYGPFMLLGSFYIQAEEISLVAVLVSIISGLGMFAITIVNEIPDYYQDRLVGKRNLVVRFGKRRAMGFILISWISAFILLGSGVWWKKIPVFSLLAFIMFPLILRSLKVGINNLDSPVSFIPTIRTSLFSYVILVICLGIGYLG